MLARILLILLAWFLLSMIVGPLLGRAISKLQELPTPGFLPPLETDGGASPKELEEAELLAMSHAQMQEVSDLDTVGSTK